MFAGLFRNFAEKIKDAIRPDFYIKIGIILLGTSIQWTDLMDAGLAALCQSIIVVVGVWAFAFWVGKQFKLDDEFNVILASAVSICGLSAAIIITSAINGDKKKLSYVASLVILMAIPLIVFVPWLVAYLDTPHAVAGALIGGTLDSTSAVAAATDRIGPLAVKIGLVTKFSQNMLVSLIAFLIAIWWTFKKAPTTTLPAKKERNKYSILWRRFPKFVLGLLAVSLLFSFVIPKNDAKAISPILDGFRIVWFSIAFVSIGIETSQTLSFKFTNSKPAITFVIAQLFNLLWATIWAYILFGGNTFDLPFLEFDR